MSTERIVNRVAQPTQLSEPGQTAPEVLGVESTPSVDLQGSADMLRRQRSKGFGLSASERSAPGALAQGDPSLGSIQEVLKTVTESPNALVRSGDFEDFRARVIRALKHMGVDTRKFFDE